MKNDEETPPPISELDDGRFKIIGGVYNRVELGAMLMIIAESATKAPPPEGLLETARPGSVADSMSPAMMQELMGLIAVIREDPARAKTIFDESVGEVSDDDHEGAVAALRLACKTIVAFSRRGGLSSEFVTTIAEKLESCLVQDFIDKRRPPLLSMFDEGLIDEGLIDGDDDEGPAR